MLKALMKSCLASLALTATLASPAAARAPESPEAPAVTTGSPAIWTLDKGNGSTITFFGSVHLLPQAQQWRTPALQAAFDKADVVVFETPISEMNTSEVQGLMQTNMMNAPGVTLSSLLKPEEKADVEKAANLVGASFAMMEPLRPWMAALQLTLAFAVKEGMDPNAGVDVLIEKEAQAAGKALDYFETGTEQLQIFTSMTQAQEIAFLVIGSRDMIEQPHMLKELLDAWARGDVKAIDAMMNDGLEEMPELAFKMLDERNAKWVNKISSQYMTDTKNYLIVVGAAHLAGEKSVVTQLRAKGANVSGP